MRTQRRLRVLPAATIAILAAAVTNPAPARAQRPPDGCVQTEVEDDSVRTGGDLHGRLMGLMALLVVAPSALLLFDDPGCGVDDPPGPRGSHAAVFGGGGIALAGEWRGGLARSGAIEVLVRGVYAEGRVDRTSLSGGVRMWDARAGYLFHSAGGLTGGVTVGYRQVRDPPDGWTQGGVLIGFPIVFTGCSVRRPCWLQWEPTYLIGEGTLAASPRMRLDVPLPRTPLVARLDVESRGVRKADPFAIGLGLGLRH